MAVARSDVGVLELYDAVRGRRLGEFRAAGGAVLFGRASRCHIPLESAAHRVCGAFYPALTGWELVNNTYDGRPKDALEFQTSDRRVSGELRSGARLPLPADRGVVLVPTSGPPVELGWHLPGWAPFAVVADLDHAAADLLAEGRAGASDASPAPTLTRKDIETLVARCWRVLAGGSRGYSSWTEVALLVGNGTSAEVHRQRMNALLARWKRLGAAPPDLTVDDLTARIVRSGRLQPYYDSGRWRADEDAGNARDAGVARDGDGGAP